MAFREGLTYWYQMHPTNIQWYETSFASDNNSGVHPDIMAAIMQVNAGHAAAYGDDPETVKAEKTLQDIFGDEAKPFFVLTGTGANISAISSGMRSYQTVFCSDVAHINVDECGSPERVIGCKLTDLASQDGKITVHDIEPCLEGRGDEHQVQPGMISITQATERGVVYRPSEIRELTRFAHDNDMLVHMDGARLSNAAAFLDCPLRDLTTNAGIDILSLGGTKNGMMYGEAVLFLNGTDCRSYRYYRKQTTQLASKMRYISAQFHQLYSTDLWLRNAGQANAMARSLADLVSAIDGVSVVHPVESNAVFASLPLEAVNSMLEHSFFYVIDSRQPVVRWMTSFDTTENQVRDFARSVQEAVSRFA